MAIGTFGGQIPSSGLGNIAGAFGPPNTPGVAAPAPRMPLPSTHGMPGPMMGGPPGPMPGQIPGGTPTPGAPTPFGNISGAMQPNMQPNGPMMGGPPGPMPGQMMGGPPGPMPGQMMGGGIGAIMSQMDPQHVAALRGIPQHAMQRLHGAGLIHPELMRHLYGGNPSGQVQ